LSGFTKRTESDYDRSAPPIRRLRYFRGAGHGGVARDLNGGKNNVIAVIGRRRDVCRQAYEAMNNAAR